MDERIRLIAWSREKPRLHHHPGAHALDPTGALRQPNIAEPPAKEATLPSTRRLDSERPQASVNQPASTPSPSSVQRSSCFHDISAGERKDRIRARHSDKNSGIWCTHRQSDPPRRPSRSGDRRIGVRHQLGNDLHQVDPALGEVLSEVAAAHMAQSHRRRIKRRHRTHIAA